MSDPIRIRASSWGDLFDCAARWEAANLNGKRMPLSPPALIGTAVHGATAVYDAGRYNGTPVTPDEAAAVAVDIIAHPGEDTNWRAGDFTPKDANWIAAGLTMDYCRDWSYKWNFRSVEMTLSPLVVDTGDALIELTGKMDRARVRTGTIGGLGITDLKTGRQAVSQGRAKTTGFKYQIGVYELLAENTYNEPVTMPGEIIALKTTGKREIAIAEIANAKALMLGTDEQPGALHMAGKMLKAGLFPPNPRSYLCSDKFCPIYSSCQAHD